MRWIAGIEALVILALAALLVIAVWTNGTLQGEKETWRKTAVTVCWRTRGAVTERRYKNGFVTFTER